jgi:prephenate dehydratase
MQSAEMRCELTADSQILAEMFAPLKAHQVNLRRLELSQNLTNPYAYRLRVEVTFQDHSAAQVEAVRQLEQRLQQLSAAFSGS